MISLASCASKIEGDAVLTNLEVTGVSVVTPAHGRERLISLLLESLKTARANSSLPSEVLIVDSSAGEEAEAIRRSCEKLNACYIHHPVNNVRQKRNLGIEKARYPIVLFIDSDCRASPDLINEHTAAYCDGVGGSSG